MLMVKVRNIPDKRKDDGTFVKATEYAIIEKDGTLTVLYEDDRATYPTSPDAMDVVIDKQEFEKWFGYNENVV